MLHHFRNAKTKKRIYWFLALVIIPSFVVTGAVLFSPEDAPSSLGKLRGRTVPIQEYLSAYKAVQHHAAMIYGQDFSKVRGQINWKNEAWDRLLLLDHAKRERIKVSDKEVVEWIQSQAVFQRGGRFDMALYKGFVAQMIGESTRRFEEEVRQILTIRKLTQNVQKEVKLDEAELKEMYAQRFGARDLAYAVLSADPNEPAGEVKDEEIAQLLEMVQDKLTAPDGRKLTPEESKAELKSLLVRDKARAAALEKLRALKPAIAEKGFENALAEAKIEVKTFPTYDSTKSLPGVDAPTLPRVIAALKEGEVSEPFEASSGAVLVKILKDAPFDSEKFEAAKTAFREQALDQKTGEALEKLLADLRKELKIDVQAMERIFPRS